MAKYSEFLSQEISEKLIDFREKHDEKIFAKSNLREAFGAGILAAAQAEISRNPDKKSNIVALSADLSSSVGMTKFREILPDNYVELGIAEQNLAGVAAGFAHVGMKPFAMSYAAFNPGRNYEQIRTMIAINNLPVTVVGTHAGLNVGPDGATHQMLEDVAMMRALPNMNVFAPADAEEAFALARFLANFDHPAYVRLPRADSLNIFRENQNFANFEPKILREGNDVTLVGYGIMTAQNLLAAEILAKKGIEAEVIHFAKLTDGNFAKLWQSVAKTGAVVVTEEHELNGGFGEEIAVKILENSQEIFTKFDRKLQKKVSRNGGIKFARVGVDNEFGQSGTAEELAKFYKIDAQAIAKKVENILQK